MAQVVDALTKLRGVGDLLRAVCRQAFTVLVEAPEINGCQTSREERAWKGTESQFTIEVAGACGRNVDASSTPTVT